MRDATAPVERDQGISLGDAVRIYATNARAIYEFERRGRLRGLRIGNRVYFSRVELEQLFARRDPSSEFGLLGSKLRFPLFVWGGLDEAA